MDFNLLIVLLVWFKFLLFIFVSLVLRCVINGVSIIFILLFILFVECLLIFVFFIFVKFNIFLLLCIVSVSVVDFLIFILLKYIVIKKVDIW